MQSAAHGDLRLTRDRAGTKNRQAGMECRAGSRDNREYVYGN